MLLLPSLLASDTRRCSLDDQPSGLDCPSSPSPLLPINSNHLLHDSPSQIVSSTISVTSPSLLASDTRRSTNDSLSEFVSLSPSSSSSSSLPHDISRSRAEPPSQPMLSSYKINNDDQSFRKQWFLNRPWLEYSIKRDRAYCYYCRHFGSTNNMINRNQSDIFLTGYNNWKHALGTKRGFKQHETSAAHITAAFNYNEFLIREKPQSNAVNVADKARIEQIRKSRERLVKISSTIWLCALQMIPLRDHDENTESI